MVSIMLLCFASPENFVLASSDKTQRTVYLHAQGEKTSGTPEVSTVYMGENVDVYFAVDNPNKGLYENNIHKEPQYDMNGYTVKMYFDPVYFEFASNNETPIDYTVPDRNIENSETGSENLGDEEIRDLPTTVGYYPYRHGSGSTVINGKTYKSAYLTVFSAETMFRRKMKDSFGTICAGCR